MEVKNSIFESESKANHLSYIGDAKIDPKLILGQVQFFVIMMEYQNIKLKLGLKPSLAQILLL